MRKQFKGGLAYGKTHEASYRRKHDEVIFEIKKNEKLPTKFTQPLISFFKNVKCDILKERN